MTIAVTADQKRRFVAAIRADRLDIGDAGRRAGLRFHEAAEIWAQGVAAGRLRMGDDAPGLRFIEEVRQ